MDAPALDAVSAKVEAGALTGLVGPDGAGKTTLMRLARRAAGAHRRVTSRCSASTPGPRPSAIHAAIGYMPQRFGLYEDLTVLENLDLYADLRGAGAGRARKETFDRLLALHRSRRASRTPARRQALRRHEAEARARLRPGAHAAAAAARRAERRRRSDLAARAVAHGQDLTERGHRRALVDRLSRRGRELRPRCCCSTRAGCCIEGDPEAMTAPGRGPRVPAARAPESGGAQLLAEALDATRRDRRRRSRARRSGWSSPRAGSRPKPRLDAGADARSSRPTPRFEDAFVDMLGGGPGGRSRLADAVTARCRARPPVIEATGLTKRFGDFTAAERHHLRDPARRDLRPARAQRGRQVDHLQDAVRAAAADERRRLGSPGFDLRTRRRPRRAAGSATWRRNSRSTAISACARTSTSSPASMASPARAREARSS